MPTPESEFPDYMTATGNTDQHKGREYRCELCGRKYWSAWGNAWRHDCRGEGLR